MDRPDSKRPPIELSREPEILRHYGRDWTRFWPSAPSAVAFPRTTAEVRDLVLWARGEKLALVPSGGRTGLSGGAVAAAGELVVSMEKMRRIIKVDSIEPSITAEAGACVGDIQRTAAEADLYYPVDWTAAASSQIGGSIATNAGGIRVLRYGMTRRWVRGLTVVTGAGEVVRLGGGLVKNNAGPDLMQLVIGSEGTLGIITEAIIGLMDPPPDTSALLLAMPDLAGLMHAFESLRRSLTLTAFEFFDRASVRAVASHCGKEFPLNDEYPFYAVVEFLDPGEVASETASLVFESLLEGGQVADGVVSQSATQAAGMWFWRERITESIADRTPYKNDLSVRIARVPEFLENLQRLVDTKYPDFEVLWFGHIGDGNLHMNVLRPDGWDVAEFHSALDALSPQVFDLVRAHGGSLSAEHGIGLLKRDYLSLIRSPTEINALRALKQVFDPDGILNPGKLLVP